VVYKVKKLYLDSYQVDEKAIHYVVFLGCTNTVINSASGMMWVIKTEIRKA